MTCKRLISPELLSESLIILSFFDGFQLLEPTTKEQLEVLQDIVDGESTNTSLRIEAITFEITVQTVISTLAIIINLPLTSLVDEERLPLPMFSLSPKNNALSRQNQILLSNYLGNLKDDDILNSISCIESFANGLVVAPVANTEEDGGISDEVKVDDEVRVWFWLQSLSTKSKRDDIVNWAPEYHLTGFVLAGKPGILCLEGKSSSINNYMSEIKSVSWSDVPSFQKKVTERHRELIPHGRSFDKMQEITDSIKQGGARGNRGEMNQVKEFMRLNGVENVFNIVLGF